MLFAFMLYLKRPIYLLGLIIPGLLALAGFNLGNQLSSLATLFISVCFWSAVCVTLYLGDDEINTNISGYDLKEVISTSWVFILIQAAVLFFMWPIIAFIPLEMEGQIKIMPFLFVPTVLNVVIGGYVLKAKVIMGLAKSGVKIKARDFQRILEDLKGIISAG